MRPAQLKADGAVLFRVRKGNDDGKSKGQRCSPTGNRGLAQGQGKKGFEVQPRSGFGNASRCALQLPVESDCSEEDKERPPYLC